MNFIKQKYHCTEGELYAITNLTFNNLEEDLVKFASKKAKYVPLFLTGVRDLRKAAMELPDEESRNGVHQTLKNLLPDLVESCKSNFMDMKGYIRDGWANEEPKPRYEQAGQTKYDKIGAHNWEQVVGLNESMINFIAANAAVLAIPGGMPGTFADKVQDDSDAFDEKYDAFMSSRETSTARNAKVSANNDLFDAMTDVNKDGVEMVYRNDDAGKKRYTFTTLKALVSPPGSASLKVKVMNEDTTPGVNLDVAIKKEGSVKMNSRTNEEGIAEFGHIDAGDYVGLVDVNGVFKSFSKEVNTGVDARVTIII